MNSFAVDNLRQYVEYTDGKINHLHQLLYTLSVEVSKLRKTVNKLKNGEDVDEDEETSTKLPSNVQHHSQQQNAGPQLQFGQMPPLQTLNLNHGPGSTQINN